MSFRPEVLAWTNFFYRQPNLSFSLHPFRRLVLPHAHCSSKRKGFFCFKGWLHDIIWVGLVHCHFAPSWIAYCNMISVSSYIFSMSPCSWYFYISDRNRWCPQLPSDETDKYLLARFRVIIWSFSLLFFCLKLTISLLNTDGATCFYRRGGNYNLPPLNISSESCTCSTIGVGWFIQKFDRVAW